MVELLDGLILKSLDTFLRRGGFTYLYLLSVRWDRHESGLTHTNRNLISRHLKEEEAPVGTTDSYARSPMGTRPGALEDRSEQVSLEKPVISESLEINTSGSPIRSISPVFTGSRRARRR